MARKMSYRWHLRQMMATHEMFQTSQLVPQLAERGIQLSREQVYRLVTQAPQRLSLEILAALCDIFSCTPNELIEIVVAEETVVGRRAGEAKESGVPDPPPAVRRTRVRRPKGL